MVFISFDKNEKDKCVKMVLFHEEKLDEPLIDYGRFGHKHLIQIQDSAYGRVYGNEYQKNDAVLFGEDKNQHSVKGTEGVFSRVKTKPRTRPPSNKFIETIV